MTTVQWEHQKWTKVNSIKKIKDQVGTLSLDIFYKSFTHYSFFWNAKCKTPKYTTENHLLVNFNTVISMLLIWYFIWLQA